jgi:RNA polymerase sigma factor (sigma-70 family)
VNDDQATFEQLYHDTRADLLAYIVRRSQSAEDAADVLAETYLIAWQKLDSIPSGARRRLWLFVVARNLLSSGARRRRSGNRLMERLAAELTSVQAGHGPIDEQTDALRAALAALSETDREIVTLAAWEGLTPREIAVVLDRSPNLIRVRLHRARARLKRRLADGRRGDTAGGAEDRRSEGAQGETTDRARAMRPRLEQAR